MRRERKLNVAILKKMGRDPSKYQGGGCGGENEMFNWG